MNKSFTYEEYLLDKIFESSENKTIEIPNKREVECCASCKFITYGWSNQEYCKSHKMADVEHYWICDDYVKRVTK